MIEAEKTRARPDLLSFGYLDGADRFQRGLFIHRKDIADRL